VRFLILISFILISVQSCKKILKKNDFQNIESQKPTEDQVILDKGNLWKANIETTFGINTMIKRMDSFSNREAINAYKILKDSLNSDFSMIFQNCTMKGEAHNQLHNYLKPMIGFFEGLESEDLVICKTSFIELEQYLNLYENYFE
jgi:hypothetical protein